MRHRLRSILLVVIALVLVWSWVKPVQVQERRAERWEDCPVGTPYYDSTARGSFLDVRHLTPAAEGVRIERVQVVGTGLSSGDDADKTLSRTIAALWEIGGAPRSVSRSGVQPSCR